MKDLLTTILVIVVILVIIAWFKSIPDDAIVLPPPSTSPTQDAPNATNDSTVGTNDTAPVPVPGADGVPETIVHENPQTKMFNVSGTNFAFDVTEMRVKEGDTVMIHFMSADGFHDLVIDEFNVRTEKLKTGGMAVATFVADKKGTFEYYCSVGQHRMNGMVGKLIVE